MSNGLAQMPGGGDWAQLQAVLRQNGNLLGYQDALKPADFPRGQQQHARQYQHRQAGGMGGLGGMPAQQQQPPPNLVAAFAQQAQQERAQALERQARLALEANSNHYPGLNLTKLLAAQQQAQDQAGPRTSSGSNSNLGLGVGRTPSIPPHNGLLLQQQQLQAYEAEMRMKQAAANIIAASQGMPGRLNLQGLNGGIPPPPLAASGRGLHPAPVPLPAMPAQQQKQAHQLQALDRLKESASAREVLKAEEMAAQYQRQSEMLRRMLLYQQQLEQQQYAGSAQAATLKQQQLQEALAKQDVLAQASARKAAEANHNAAVQSLMAMRGFTPVQAQNFRRNVDVLRAVQAQENITNNHPISGLALGKGMDPMERGEQRAATDRALMAAHISRMQQAGNVGAAEQQLLLLQQAQQAQPAAAAAAVAASNARGGGPGGGAAGGGSAVGGLEQAHARNLDALMSGGRLSLAQAQNLLRNASLLRAIRSHERTHFVPIEQQAAIQRAVTENEHINNLPLEQQPGAIEAMANALLPAHSIPRAQLAAARNMGVGMSSTVAAHLAQQAQQAQQPQLPFLQQVAAMASTPLGSMPPSSMQLPQSLPLPPPLHPHTSAAASMAHSSGQLPLPFPPQIPPPPPQQNAANMVSPSMPMGARAANHLQQLTGAFPSAQQGSEHDQGWMASLLAKASPHVPPVSVSAEAGLSGLEGLGVHAGMTKEQRRLALACVALQLVRGGISVEQAINLGIMGGMSVTDVRFIVECYNAERERMRQGSAATAAAAQMPLPPTPSTLTSQLGSPSPSMTSSAADSGALMQQRPSGSGGVEPHKGSAASQAPMSFNAFSYGFFGGDGNSGPSVPPAQATPEEDALEPLGPGTGNEARNDRNSPDGATDGATGKADSKTSDPPAHSVPVSEVHRGLNGNGNGVGLEGSSLFGGSPGSESSGFGAFSSINMGGFGTAQNREGHEQAPSGQPDSLSAEERELLQAAADANHRLWEGAPDEEGIESNVDLAARLANLDLGSGFF